MIRVDRLVQSDRPFRVAFCPCVKASLQNHSYQTSFLMEGFPRLMTCFETEAQGNSEMAYVLYAVTRT